MSKRFFIALDLDDRVHALTIARETRDFVAGYKVGPRACLRFGSKFIEQLADLAPVFIDNKYFDIPSTMVAAVRASFDLGASFVTVHAGAGITCLKKLSQLEAELNRRRPFRLLAVTVLTSFSDADPPPLGMGSVNEQVFRLAEVAVQGGLSGIVCSPHEAANLRERFPNIYMVTPGIRLSAENSGDQKRTMGPREALSLGASALVIGRPIVEATHPRSVAEQIYELTKTLT